MTTTNPTSVNRNANKVVQDYRRIRRDYAYVPDVMAEGDVRTPVIQEIISTKLTPADRTIILLYTDCQSLRQLGHKMGLSHTTCRREVIRIRQIIMNEYRRRLYHGIPR